MADRKCDAKIGRAKLRRRGAARGINVRRHQRRGSPQCSVSLYEFNRGWPTPTWVGAVSATF
jgi:hypothetical protein